MEGKVRMKNKIMKLALGLVMGLSFIPAATAADTKPVVDVKVEQTQEQSIGALVDAVIKAASGISAKDLNDKIKSPEGDLATALKAVTDAGYMLVSYGTDGDEIKAATKIELVGKSPQTSDGKPARGVAADKLKDAKDGKAFFTYTNAKKEERAVVAFKLGDALCTIGGAKK